MRRIFTGLMLGLVLFVSGCGGGESSYKDRDIDPNDPANAQGTPIPPPDAQGQ